MKDNEYEFPGIATIRKEPVRCGNPDCQQLHGPIFTHTGRTARDYKKIHR